MTGDTPAAQHPLELPTLRGEKVRLRAFTVRDAGAVQEASRDELIPRITSVPPSHDHDSAVAFIARQHERLTTGAGYSFAVADVESDEVVGQIGLWLREIDHRRASIGYWVKPTARLQGYATDALAVDWALLLPQLRRLELYVEPWNVGSCKTAEHAGFQRECLLRQWQPIGGEQRDMYMYSLIPD